MRKNYLCYLFFDCFSSVSDNLALQTNCISTNPIKTPIYHKIVLELENIITFCVLLFHLRLVLY